MDFTKDSIESSIIVHDYEAGQCDSLTPTVNNSYSVDGSQTVQELSAWEKWIIRKAQIDRAKAEQEQLLRVSPRLYSIYLLISYCVLYIEMICLQRKENEGAKVLRRTQREKKRKSEHAYREWLADKAKKEAGHIQRERSDVKQRLEDIEKVLLSIYIYIRAKTNAILIV